MGLFDNIFLDEDATTNATAVMEKTEEAPPEVIQTEQIPEASSQGESTESVATTTDTAIQAPEEQASSGVSFDIGGDLDFGSTPATDAANEANPETPAEAIQDSSSFTVNGVTYNTQDAADSAATSTEAVSAPEVPQESIAMIQGSTAATGINIIESATTEVASDTTATTTDIAPASTDSTTESNPFINILSSDSKEETQESVSASTTPDPEATFSLTDMTSPEVEIPALIDDPVVITSEIQQEETKSPEKESDAVVVESNSPLQIEADKPFDPIQEASNEMIAPVVSIENNSSDLGGILSGFIGELNEREMEINRIIMKRHELAKRRTEIEENYKTRILALNMEDEFLKNKADRERAEQDKLQHVIKSFQKQIAANE